jgi:tRNA 2-selenouridine synthase
VESLAGVFHPHAIEVQDFGHYGLVIDVRSLAEYENDHVPGAVRLEPAMAVLDPDESRGDGPADECAGCGSARAEGGPQSERAADGLPTAVAELVATARPSQAILLYCGQGGAVSQPLARQLRRRGWTVDVLPGGWVNYRRWVQAGLEVLPRLIAFRVIVGSLGSEVARVLQALRDAGHQVLDLEGLAAWHHGKLHPANAAQPAQAWFESQLLEALRAFDLRAPVWVGDVPQPVGTLAVPGALQDALAIAPAALLQIDPGERAKCWCEEEPVLAEKPEVVVEALAAQLPVSVGRAMVQRYRHAACGSTDGLLANLLSDHIDPAYATAVAERAPGRHPLPPLVVNSLAPAGLAAAISAWL